MEQADRKLVVAGHNLVAHPMEQAGRNPADNHRALADHNPVAQTLVELTVIQRLRLLLPWFLLPNLSYVQTDYRRSRLTLQPALQLQRRQRPGQQLQLLQKPVPQLQLRIPQLVLFYRTLLR